MIEDERGDTEELAGEHPDFSDDEIMLLEELMLEKESLSQGSDEEE